MMKNLQTNQLQKFADKHADQLLFIPLGGVGEIGMNAYLYHYKGSWILIDVGIGFADYRMPGIDTLLPDLDVFEHIDLDAVVITHSHEDHIGAIASLIAIKPVPIYSGIYTELLVKQKLTHVDNLVFHTIAPDEMFSIGALDILPKTVAHSVPEAFAFYLQTDFGTVIHSGDWKYDAEPSLQAEKFVKENWVVKGQKIKAMVCDSTNIMVAGSAGSESSLVKPLQQVIDEAKGHRLFITTFASNLARMQNIMQAGHQSGRKIMLMGRAMWRIYQAGKEMNWFANLPEPLGDADYEDADADKLLIMVTGSQGEGRSMLAKISRGEIKKIQINANDKVIFSSRTIPGNEIGIGQMQNRIAELGAEIIDAEDNASIHVSGHYQQQEIINTYALLKPEWVIPVHGEARHLRTHAKVAQAAGLKALYVPHNGMVVAIGEAGASLVAELPIMVKMVEPSGLVLPADALEIADRRKIIWNGVITMALAINKKDKLQGYPHLQVIGMSASEDILEQLEDKLQALFLKHQQDGLELDSIIEKLKNMLRKESRIYFRKRPVISVSVLQV